MSVFYEYILSYVSILMIAALLGVTLIQNAAKRIEAEYLEQKIHRAEMLKTQIDNMTESLIRSSYLLAMDDTRRQVILTPTPYNEYMLIRELKQLKPSDLSGGNLFLCSADDDCVYDVNGKSEKAMYWNAQLNMNGRENELSDWLYLNNCVFMPCRDDDGQTQLLFVYPLKYVTWYAGDRQAFIITHFSPTALQKLERSFKGDMTDDFILFWGNTPVLGTVDADHAEDLLKIDPARSVVTQIVGDRHCVALNPSFPGLRLILIAGNNEILTFKNEYLQKLVLIMLPFLLFGLMLVIWYVMRHYKPIKQLASHFEPAKNQTGNEFQRIGEGIEQIHQKDSELIERIGEIDQELKHMLLEGVINGIRAEKEELIKAGVDMNNGVRSILCAKGADEEGVQALKAQSLCEIGDGVKAVWSEKYTSLVLIAPAAEESGAYAEQIMKKGSIRVGISYFADGENGIRRAFLQALSACEEAEMNGVSTLVYNSESVRNVDGMLVNRYMYLQKAIQGGNAILSAETLSGIRTQIEKHDFAEAKCEQYVLLNTLRRCATELQTKLSADDLFQAVSSERPEVFYDVIGKLLDALCREAARQREEMNLSIQNDVIAYIDAHFADYEISMEGICIRFKLSANNLSHIVKDRTGCTPREYIIKLRMEEAQKLLMETDESVNSISRKVGYAGASHFIKTYKQYYNVTPAQMRGGNRQ